MSDNTTPPATQPAPVINSDSLNAKPNQGPAPARLGIVRMGASRFGEDPNKE